MEDPWGQYSLRAGSDVWTEQLPKLLRTYPGPDHQFVITSRTDMLKAAEVGDSLKHWWVELDASNYEAGQIARIYDRRSSLMPPDLQDKALSFRAQALGVFTTPLQVDLYFSHLAKGSQEGEKDHELLARLLKLADRDAVADEIARYLKVLDCGGAPAATWAMLAARGHFDRDQLVVVRRALRRVDRELSDDLEGLIDRFVAASYLRQPEQSVAFAHPSVREGFEAFVTKDWAHSEGAIADLIAGLTQVSGLHRDWALETAARAVQVARVVAKQIPDLDPPFEVDKPSQDAIDQWLEAGLVEPGSAFEPLLQLAADVGSGASLPSEVARWLLRGVKRGADFFLATWAPPSFDNVWYQRVAADPRTRVVAERFVREALPWESGMYGPHFAAHLDRLARELTPAFIDAAAKMVGGGYDGNVQAVANGAVRDIPAYEPILNAALSDLAKVAHRASTEGAETWRAIEDGEVDADFEEGYRSSHEDDGYASGVFVDAYVAARRAAGDWEGIRDHARHEELVPSWGRLLATSPSGDEAEVRALVALARCHEREHFAWWALRENWRPEFVSIWQERFLSAPDDPNLRDELAFTGLAKAPAELAGAISGLNNPARLVADLVDVREAAAQRLHSAARASAMRKVVRRLPATAAEIMRALPTKRSPAQAVGPDARTMLEAAAESARPDTLSAIVPVIIASGGKPTQVIARWLAETTDRDLAVAAVEAAISMGDEGLLKQALGHSRADARRAALLALRPSLPAELPTSILVLARDKGSRVRREMVRILGDRTSAAHQRLLLDLTGDRWSDAEPYYDEPASYPIAREAVEALAGYEKLDDETGERLLKLADETRDRLLSSYALILAAHNCGPRIREKIWAIACRPEARWIRVDALGALAEAPLVENSIVEQVTGKLLITLPPVLAVPATTLLARHAAADVAVSVLEKIASSNKHLALLLVGAVGLEERDMTAAARVMNLLGPRHPAGQLFDKARLIPAHALDDLGPARLRKAVREKLGDRIAS
jgi:hypothetical protein